MLPPLGSEEQHLEQSSIFLSLFLIRIFIGEIFDEGRGGNGAVDQSVGGLVGRILVEMVVEMRFKTLSASGCEEKR